MFPLEGRSCAVTGGCGFIGSHLVRGLLQAGVRRVVVLDSLQHGDPTGVAEIGPEVERVRFTLGTDPPDTLAAALAGCDYVVHLAALKHRAAGEAPRALLSTNVTGTWELLRAAVEAGARKVVFSSSLFAHGGRHAPAQQEDDPPRPDTVYGASKLAGEHLLRASGLPHLALRYFFVYGPGQHAGQGYPSVIVRNLERLRAGQRPTVYGDGRQVLDYVYVDDVVEATLLALESPTAAGVLNIGSGEPTAIDDLLTEVSRAAASPLPKEYVGADETAGTWRVARIDRAREVLGWRPRISLGEGLARTWAALSEEPARP
jgi:UDP-glucose 4-epimerase